MKGSSMLVEIRKAGFINKGAELMQLSVLQMMKERYPGASFAMETGYGAAPYIKRAKSGYYQKAQLWFKGIQFGIFFNFIPKVVRNTFGIVLDKELDVVLDAAGFAYGDQWGVTKTKVLANSCRRWKRYGVKVILLPQAFGPFSTRDIKKQIRIAIDNSDLVFARDEISYQNLVDVVGEQEKIMLAPDFTNLIKGIVPDNYNPSENSIAVVPNSQMINMTSSSTGDLYFKFMVKAISYLLKKGEKPFFLIHEKKDDYKLVCNINDSLEETIPIMEEDNPLKIKGILGECKVTIGSRYHGLISALSQGVPSLATGWSHKYEMLFEDYRFEEGIIDLNSTDEEVHKKIDWILENDKNKEIRSDLSLQADKLRSQSQLMWDNVFKIIDEV